MDKTVQSNSRSYEGSKRSQALHIPIKSLPSSRSSSPRRNVKIKREVFEKSNSDNPPSAKPKINTIEKSEADRFRSLSPSSRDREDSKIEAEDKIHQSSIADKVRSNDLLPATGNSLVQAFSKSSRDLESEKNELENLPVKNTSSERARKISSTSVIDRLADVRTAPDYVSVFSKPVLAVEKDQLSSEAKEVASTRVMGKRTRAATRNKRMQAKKEETTQKVEEAQTATSKQPYVPEYIQPVPAAVKKIQTGPVIDVCRSQARTGVRQTSTVLNSDPLKTTVKSCVNIIPSRVNHNRRSSSDSSNGEVTTRPKLPSSDGQPATGTLDNPPESQISREVKRTRRRLRKAQRQTNPPDNQSSRNPPGQTMGNISQRMQFFQPSTTSQNQGELTSSRVNTSRSPINYRSRTKYRKQDFVETEEKYSTLPANFSPSIVQDNEFSNRNSSKSGALRFQQTNTTNGKYNQSKPLNELMITHKQILADKDDSKTKSYVLRPNSVNQSKDSVSRQRNEQPSIGIDRSDIAGGDQDSIGKKPPFLPQNKSNQVGSLRSLFNAEEGPKVEFGQAYNKQEPQHRVKIISKNVIDGQNPDKESVLHSKPMLRAVKLREDYWPRDEATEKLLNRNNMHSSESNKRPNRTLNTVDDRSDLSNRAMTERKENTVSIDSSDLPNSPKETNLSDPVDLSESDRCLTHSPKHLAPSTSSNQGQGQDFRDVISHDRSKKLQALKHNPLAAPERTTRSQSLDSGADAYMREKPPSPRWSFDDPDSKLQEFENALESIEDKASSSASGENTEVSCPRSTEPNPAIEVDLNFAPMRPIYLNGAALYEPLQFDKANKHLQTQNTVNSQELGTKEAQSQKSETSHSSESCQDHALSSKSSQSNTVSGNNTTQSISTRKNSVVSRSTALPRHFNAPSPDAEAGDIDEGCVIEDATSSESISMNVALFKHPSLAQGNSVRGDERNEFGVCTTPNSRRRRKYSAAGQNNSDSSNTSNNTESSRSLSDPIPTRKKSLNETEEEMGPVDSNFQYPLKPGNCVKEEEPQLNNSASDLSGCSAHTSIQSDFNEMEDLNKPHAIEQALAEYDAKNSAKTKKKSFSDPTADAVLAAGLLNQNEEELDQASIYSSSSESDLSDQRDEADELTQSRSFSPIRRYSFDRIWDENTHTVGTMTQSLEEMSQTIYNNNRIARSPRVTRKMKSTRPRMRANRSRTPTDDYDDLQHTLSEGTDSSSSSIASDPVADNALEKAEEQFQTIFDRMSLGNTDDSSAVTNPVHARSCSEPAVRDDLGPMLTRKATSRGRRPGIVQAPSLSDVLQKDSTLQTNLTSSKPLSNSTDGILTATFPRPVAERGLGYKKYGGQGRAKLDMRRHVVDNLLETEASYVKSLRILFETYFQPLKRPENHSVCEPRLVDEIFFQIPQILQHHETFYANVQDCVEHWDHENIMMGDVFIQSFNKDKLLESYTNYIKNYLNAKEAVNIAIEARSAFKNFLEQCQRENKEKQGLSDLMIKPVQRIPRYELIIKDLLKHTPEDHPDRACLLIAQREIHALSVQMNKGEKDAEAADRHARLLQEIEQLVEGCMDIGGTAKRRFLHQDICNELKNGNKKERSLWLFNDMLMCTTSKKGGRASSLRRSSMNLFSMSPDRVMIDFTCRYKYIWKFPLDDVDLLKGSTGPNQYPNEKQLQQLQTDQELLHKIEDLADKITIPHGQLDESIKDLLQITRQGITDKQQQSRQSLSLPGRLEIGIPTPDGMKLFQFEFPTEDSKAQFEHLFWDAKKSFTSYKRKWEPTFMKAIPISKTRNGMQFSCAAPNIDTSPGTREVWVCNTDGYVGQICFLTLEPEPLQTQCLTVCNAKICCIEQVPTWGHKLVPTNSLLKDISMANLGAIPRRRSSSSNPARNIISWDSDESDEDNTSPISTMSNISPYSTNSTISNLDVSNVGGEIVSSEAASGSRAPPNSVMNALLGGGAYKKDSDGSTLHGSLEDLLNDDSNIVNGGKLNSSSGSMWLGTEDGKINIFSTAEALRTNNRPHLLKHAASVHCILHHGGQVFVALSNGDLVIYNRNAATNGQWEFNNKKCIAGTSSNSPITKMVVVNGKELWCGCQNQIRILDMKNHSFKSSFPVTQDNKRQIFCMVCFGFGVWVALDRRSHIKLFHSITHELIAEVDVSHPVSKILASSDAIIRQHKAACLRITSLLVCENLVWVGTSAGVVLTMALPIINVSTASLPLPVMPQGLPYGHTGHVRFLTSVEVADQESQVSGGRNPVNSTATIAQPRSNTLVISGGDGYEDFRMNSASEVAGREDSTNHLLVWKV